MWRKKNTESTALLHSNSLQFERRRRSNRLCTKSIGLVLVAVIVCSGVVVCMLQLTLNAANKANTNKHRLNSTAVGRFLHITDMHVDPGYIAGSTTYSQCHRYPPHAAGNDTAGAAIGDGHRHTGRFGIPQAKCDSPIALINATSKHLRSKWGADKLDFVIWTGDSGRHDGDPEQPRTFEQIIAGNSIAVHALRDAFGDSMPIVPNIGNNDISPHNELAAPGHKTARKTFERLSHAWHKFVPDDQLRTFLYGGYFAKDVVDYDSPGSGESTGITALSLNTIYWYRANAKVGGCRAHDSPGLAQLAWIRYQMRRARARNRDLILLGHVLPNRDNYRPTCYHGYARTVTQVVPAPALHRNPADGDNGVPAVHAQLFGHSNVDVWAFVGQEAKWTSSLDPLGLGDQQNGSIGDNRLWWERQVDEETGRFGKLIRNVWEATSFDINNHSLDVGYDDERLWEEMEDDPPVQFTTAGSSAEILPIPEATSNISAPQRLPSDFVETLLKEYKRVLVEGPKNQQNLGVTTISPSIIPKYVPAFRIFHYLRKRPESNKQRWWSLPLGTLLDYDVHWADIAKLNKLKLNPIYEKFFTKLYRFSDVYKIDDLSLDSYLKWAEKLLSSKSLRKKFRSLTYLGT
ncbi:Endopolyphosphatase [Coemansia brasiliensis]|uniref:Endopolyphosphatase n=1 Tax=Coemansia brasiliensis TaxID=2650707 RepID=A0A9W8LZJ6_9FUNG|nr:Endopolyphosphatase [Coemansia brasiliensis]